MKTLEEILADVYADNSVPPNWTYKMTYSHEPYYLFLYRLVKRLQPKLVVELGTDKGTSAIFMATANPEAKIISIDIDRISLENLQTVAKAHELNNLTTYLGSSTEQTTLDMVRLAGKVDLLFIDTLHTFAQASTEYRLYKSLLNEKAIVVHDDTRFSDEMKCYWQSIPEPKTELLHLHHSGFGISR